ncbi:16403_t:CDS:2, partial [Acaulospora colombiana]
MIIKRIIAWINELTHSSEKREYALGGARGRNSDAVNRQKMANNVGSAEPAGRRSGYPGAYQMTLWILQRVLLIVEEWISASPAQPAMDVRVGWMGRGRAMKKGEKKAQKCGDGWKCPPFGLKSSQSFPIPVPGNECSVQQNVLVGKGESRGGDLVLSQGRKAVHCRFSHGEPTRGLRMSAALAYQVSLRPAHPALSSGGSISVSVPGKSEIQNRSLQDSLSEKAYDKSSAQWETTPLCPVAVTGRGVLASR